MKSLLIITILSLGLTSIAYAHNATTTSSSHNSSAQSIEEKNLATGNAFLAANKKKSGVITTASGLQYIVIIPGNGKQPTDDDIVTVNYSGKLINGTEFDSSYKRGQPATFPVSGVIPGWTEALKLMKKGSTYELFIPASLAYGEQGAPPVIGPNETLIFKVDLIDVKKQ